MELGTIIDLALLGVFVIFLLTAVIAFFIGLSRGLIKETIKAVIRALLVLSLFFTASPIANFIGNFDLSIFTGSGERLTINSLIMDYIYNHFQISPCVRCFHHRTSLNCTFHYPDLNHYLSRCLPLVPPCPQQER